MNTLCIFERIREWLADYFINYFHILHCEYFDGRNEITKARFYPSGMMPSAVLERPPLTATTLLLLLCHRLSWADIFWPQLPCDWFGYYIIYVYVEL